MAVPTQYVTMDLSAQFAPGSLEVRRKVKVNPFAAATGGTTTPPSTLPPAPPVGLIYPR